MSPISRSGPFAAKLGLLIALCMIALPSPAPAVEPALAVPVCTDQQLLGFAPKYGEVESHRRFHLPKITYPFGTPLPVANDWGFALTIRLDEFGRVSCYGSRGRFQKPLVLNDERRALLAALPSWSYSPFVRNGTPLQAIVTEEIHEEELPRQHLTPPTVPLEKVHIVLERTNCFGTCPSYKVELFGDGTAVYSGQGYVDVLGVHRYRIDPEKVAMLYASVLSNDLWSVRSEYTAAVSDSAT